MGDPPANSGAPRVRIRAALSLGPCVGYFFQEVDLRPPHDARPLHSRSQVPRLRKLARRIDATPLEEDDGLLGSIHVAEKACAFRPTLLPSGTVGIVQGLPLFEVSDLVSNQDVGHGVTSLPYDLIRHKVRNFKKWKPLYDAHGTTRK